MYWGTHFSTLKKSPGAAESRRRVFVALLHAFNDWNVHAVGTSSIELKETISEITKWISGQIVHHFSADYMEERRKFSANK
jgi:ATP phosphoribosyltransferase regulatory subunit HisZ